METISAIIMDVLLVCFSISVLVWGAIGVQSIIHALKREERDEKKALQDDEYHAERMKALGR